MTERLISPPIVWCELCLDPRALPETFLSPSQNIFAAARTWSCFTGPRSPSSLSSEHPCVGVGCEGAASVWCAGGGMFSGAFQVILYSPQRTLYLEAPALTFWRAPA